MENEETSNLMEGEELKYQTAKESLSLLPQSFSRDGNTTSLQLFMFLTNICEKRKEEFLPLNKEKKIRDIITDIYGKPDAWSILIKDPIVQNHFEEAKIDLKNNLINTISNIKKDNSEDVFYETFKELPVHMKGVRKYLKQEEIEEESFQEAYSNVVEVLFMLQRGNNKNFNNLNDESNKRRCADGFWIDCMREIGIATGHKIAKNMMEIEKCDVQ